MQLAYGTVQRKLTLDHHIEQLARPASELDPQTLAALRLGLYQLVFLDGVAAHAAVGESVELAKGGRSGGHKLVNAVLRRAARGELPALPADDTPAGAAIAHSYPPWLVELWWEHFGADETRALLRAGNEPGELALRVNPLRATPAAVRAALGASRTSSRTPAGDELPEALIVDGAFDAHGHPLYARGRVHRAVARRDARRARARPAARRARARPLRRARRQDDAPRRAHGQRRARSSPSSATPRRAAALQRTVRADGRDVVRVVTRPTPRRFADRTTPFDRVLVDPPCSGLGTLQGHPDLRWRMSPAAIETLAPRQAQILQAARAAVRPGGAIVYSTCTLSPAENEAVVAASGLPIESERLVLPHRDRTDGFYIARLAA